MNHRMPVLHTVGEGSYLFLFFQTFRGPLSPARATWANLHILDPLAQSLPAWVDNLEINSVEMQKG